MKEKKIRITHLLRPHWAALAGAFVAVIGETVTDLLEPWPLKIVFDYVLSSKHMPVWLGSMINVVFGKDRLAILSFAAMAVLGIALVGAKIGRAHV